MLIIIFGSLLFIFKNKGKKQKGKYHEGFFIGIGMVLGISIGISLDMLPIGLGVGMAIGAALETQAKKKVK